MNLIAAHSTSILLLPANYRSSLANPNWRADMADEFKALIDNDKWRLVPRPSRVPTSSSGNWIFKHKYHSNHLS